MNSFYLAPCLKRYHFKLLFLFAAFLVLGLHSYAKQDGGGHITYKYIGNNQYLVTATIYRDCHTSLVPNMVALEIRSDVCGISIPTIFLTQAQGTPTSFSLYCPGVHTTCSGGTMTDVDQFDYEGVVTIPTACPDWNFSFSDCCRTYLTTLMGGNSIYVESYLNNTIINNSSPVFLGVPPFFGMIGQDNNFYPNIIDTVEHDSLVFSFVSPLMTQNLPNPYMPGYSIKKPISSMPPVSIDHATGAIFMHPTAAETGDIAVLILEYHNGILTGSVLEDFVVFTMNSTNSLPRDSNLLGNNNRTVSYNGGNPNPICFTIYTADNDLSDLVTISLVQGIPGATFTITPSQRSRGKFCWKPALTDIRQEPYLFQILVRDNHCPVPGYQVFTYAIYVN